MSSLITSLKDLVASIFEVIFSTFKGAFDAVYGILLAFVNFLVGIASMALHTVKGTLEAAGGVGKFIASNILVIAVIAIGAYGYLDYQRRQGRSVKVGDKKLN
ncbi:uncharacterized protein N7498_006740 [Penicillium cinerascens]|uniref:Uncharacterized protein n=1 Tax=Penicillium cinerascens TaxID=70096 RepID=A0A9W9MIU5_9EURO|nr:uncharacterized protein N7498_006740 [Penicillium cinerascens]KAJ5202077.1 hypothetical protein N7498_006740 [Penicillium cinerascens]